MNRDNMMAKLAQMQEQMAKAQEELENRVAEGTAGGGAVKVEITGAYHVKSLHIEPGVVDADDLGMLEDLVTAAVNEALTQVQGFHAEQTAAMTGGLDLSSLGLPGLGGPAGGAAGGGAPGNRAARRAQKR
ncbi:MAG TPA: YbaB/EbfC family nucleoid-associated protein [Dehalococcoidia bacterium]|nr:YbaB/EbfC family nucleoid-associated protein [Dehalococcoidia bacterium]